MERFFLLLYESIPTLFVAAVYGLAALGFILMWARARRGAVVIAAPVALAVAVALMLLMLSYLVIVPNTALSFPAKSGFQRMLITFLGFMLIVFNWSAFWKSHASD